MRHKAAVNIPLSLPYLRMKEDKKRKEPASSLLHSPDFTLHAQDHPEFLNACKHTNQDSPVLAACKRA